MRFVSVEMFHRLIAEEVPRLEIVRAVVVIVVRLLPSLPLQRSLSLISSFAATSEAAREKERESESALVLNGRPITATRFSPMTI